MNVRNVSEGDGFGRFRMPAIREWCPYDDETVAACKFLIAIDVKNRQKYYRNLYSLSLLISLQ